MVVISVIQLLQIRPEQVFFLIVRGPWKVAPVLGDGRTNTIVLPQDRSRPFGLHCRNQAACMRPMRNDAPVQIVFKRTQKKAMGVKSGVLT